MAAEAKTVNCCMSQCTGKQPYDCVGTGCEGKQPYEGAGTVCGGKQSYESVIPGLEAGTGCGNSSSKARTPVDRQT